MEGTERQRVPCQESATLLEFLLEIVQVTGRNCHGMVSRLSVLPRRKVERDHFYLDVKPWQLTLPPGRSGFHRAHRRDALVWGVTAPLGTPNPLLSPPSIMSSSCAIPLTLTFWTKMAVPQLIQWAGAGQVIAPQQAVEVWVMTWYSKEGRVFPPPGKLVVERDKVELGPQILPLGLCDICQVTKRLEKEPK